MVFGAAVPRDWIEWAALATTFVGVAIAIWQSVRSGRIARAAALAVGRAEQQLAGNHILSKLAHLESLEQELDTAINDDIRERLGQLLIRWRQECSELQGILEQRPQCDAEVIASLKRVAALATQSQLTLSDGRANVRAATKQLRQEIAEALGHTARHAGQLKTSTGGMQDA